MDPYYSAQSNGTDVFWKQDRNPNVIYRKMELEHQDLLYPSRSFTKITWTYRSYSLVRSPYERYSTFLVGWPQVFRRGDN